MKEIVGYTRFGSIIEVSWELDFADWKVVEVSEFLDSREVFDSFAVLFGLYIHLASSGYPESRKRAKGLSIFLGHFLMSHSHVDFRAREAELGMKSPFEIVKYGRTLLHPAFK